jgi:D-beta-D-heptose 7-phosphate kinase / D-beta-D-heptose 1-phosphate adenosyltransferase
MLMQLSRASLVTGCFDILHTGHVLLLEHAAEISDIVIVAVNSDGYVRRRKPSKVDGPYLDEVSRATMVASLSAVSIVTIFDEDTPEGIIELIRPDVLVMGEEYQSHYDDGSLPGYEFIRRHNIQVVCRGFEQAKGLSSSNIASRIKNRSTQV